MPGDDPFRILLLGDFGPDAGAGTRAPLARRPVRRVDRDDLDRVLAACAPRVSIPNPDGAPDSLTFGRLADLDVEHILQRAPSTARWLDLRDRLRHRDTFEEAAREAGLSYGEERPAPAPAADPPSGGAFTLDDVLAASAPQEPEADEWRTLARDLVREELDRIRVPGKPAGQDECVAAVEAALQARLRVILRDPAFRAVEAAWRGVHLLTRRLATDTDLSLHLLDCSQDELAADVGVSGELEDSVLFRRLVEETVGTTGAPPWSLVVALHEYGATPRDVAALLRVGRLAAAARAPFVAGAARTLFGCGTAADLTDADTWNDPGDPIGEQLWAALRGTPEASSVGLVWPRVLLRAPRGSDTAPVEGLAFEELARDDSNDVLTWGNGALVAALLLGEAFSRAGWDLRRGGLGADVEDLPAVLREDGGERALVPCAEILLRGRALDRVTERGAIPLLSHAAAATVRLGGLHSLAASGAELAGRWL